MTTDCQVSTVNLIPIDSLHNIISAQIGPTFFYSKFSSLPLTKFVCCLQSCNATHLTTFHSRSFWFYSRMKLSLHCSPIFHISIFFFFLIFETLPYPGGYHFLINETWNLERTEDIHSYGNMSKIQDQVCSCRAYLCHYIHIDSWSSFNWFFSHMRLTWGLSAL